MLVIPSVSRSKMTFKINGIKSNTKGEETITVIIPLLY